MQERFREFTREAKGQIRGELGRLVERALIEYMDNSRLARIEARIEEVERQQHEILRVLEEGSSATLSGNSAHAHTDGGDRFDHLNQQVRGRILQTIEHLPEGQVTESQLKQAVYSAGQTDDRTIDKYKRILESEGVLLPEPVAYKESGEPVSEWIHGVQSFAARCEQSSKIDANDVDNIIGTLEDEKRLFEEEYRDALPDDFGTSPLKIDQIAR